MPIAPVTLPQTEFKKLLTLIDIYLLKNDISNKVVEITIVDPDIIENFAALSLTERIELVNLYKKVNWLVVYADDGMLIFNKILYKGR